MIKIIMGEGYNFHDAEKLYGEITSAFEKAKVDGRGGDTPPTPPAPSASEPEKDLPFR